MEKTPREVLQGVCHFFFETGNWAFQDAHYIQKSVGRGFCKKCGKWLLNNQSGPPLESDCPDNAHEEEIGEVWDHKGLHILKDGDHLVIHSRDNLNEIVWSGIIKLRQHGDQDGIDRKTWAAYFFKEYPAELVPARKP